MVPFSKRDVVGSNSTATKVRKKIFGNPMTKITFFYRRLDVFQVVHVIFLYCENLLTL